MFKKTSPLKHKERDIEAHRLSPGYASQAAWHKKYRDDGSEKSDEAVEEVVEEVVEEEILKVDDINTPDVWEGEENTFEHKAWLRKLEEKEAQDQIDAQTPQIQEEEEKDRRAEKYTFWEDQPNKPEDYIKRGDKWFFREKGEKKVTRKGRTFTKSTGYTGEEIDITNGSVGRHLQKYGLPTPKTGDDLANEIFDVQDSVTETNARVIKTIADDYFNMKGFKRPSTTTGRFGGQVFENTEEEDLKIHFCGGKGSCPRYEMYVKYKQSNTLDEKDLDVIKSSNPDLVTSKVNLRKKELTEQHIGNLSEEERLEALVYMPSIFGENKLNLSATKANEEQLAEYYKYYGIPSKSNFFKADGSPVEYVPLTKPVRRIDKVPGSPTEGMM